MLEYDLEAPNYDATRGGEERAEAAAAAIRPLLPQSPATVLDIACGTAIVSTRLRAPGRRVVGVDRSPGMLAYARPRLDGHVSVGDGTRLPLADASVDAVTVIWLLQLLDGDTSAAVITDAARVLRPGGRLITTVEKNFAPFVTPSDVARIVEPAQRAHVPVPPDGPERVVEIGARHGLALSDEAGFVGRTQGRPPTWWSACIRTRFDWPAGKPDLIAELCEKLEALPDQDAPRPDPVFRIAVLTKES